MDALCGLDVGSLQPHTPLLLHAPCSPSLFPQLLESPSSHPREVSFSSAQGGCPHLQESLLEDSHLCGGCPHLSPASIMERGLSARSSFFS